MFQIRLSTTNSTTDAEADIDLTEVPAVGDSISIGEGPGSTPIVYKVLARTFEVGFHNGKQLKGQAVLLHVERV